MAVGCQLQPPTAVATRSFSVQVIVKRTGFGLLPHPTGMRDALQTHEIIPGS